jgi:hypothetical protein
MSDDTKLYISVESRAGHLVIDGPMTLWRELMGSLGTVPDESGAAVRDSRSADHQLAEDTP